MAVNILLMTSVCAVDQLDNPLRKCQEEINQNSLDMQNKASIASMYKTGSYIQNLRINTILPDEVPLEISPCNYKKSPDSVTDLKHFFEFSLEQKKTTPPVSEDTHNILLLAFETTIDQHCYTVLAEDLTKLYSETLQILSQFSQDQQLIMARFCLSFIDFTEISDAALAEFMRVLKPEELLAQSIKQIESMLFEKNKKACLTLKDSIEKSLAPISTSELYEIYALTPSLFYDNALPLEKICLIDKFIHPHPHFELSKDWKETKEFMHHLKSTPNLIEYKQMARDFNCLATYATSNMNKAMIRNWLTEHKATPILRNAIVKQTAALMNKPDFSQKRITDMNITILNDAMTDVNITIFNDALSLKYINHCTPRCQPTEILEAIYQTTANRHDLSENAKIKLHQEIIKSLKNDAGLSDSDIAHAIYEIFA